MDEPEQKLPPDLSSTTPAGTDPDKDVDGGPTDGPGIRTTTGGSAGPASFPRHPNPGAGPTTTGDATSGGMGTPVGGSTSDATTGGELGAVGGSDTDPEDQDP